MRVIRKIAERGRAVICTVHQPSAQLLSMFDRMLLLASGGRTVFFGEIGEEANELVEYFMGAEIPKGSFRPTIGLSQNPASWMLEVIGAGTGVDKSRIPDYAEIFKQSALHKLNQDQLAILSKPKGQVPTFETPYARSFTVQFSQLLLRLARVYFRDIQYNNLRFCLLAFLGVIIGLLFRDIDDSDEFGVISKMSSVFVTAGFLGFLMGSMAMPVVLRMRNVFYREQASHAYSPIWYANALALVELPYLALAVMVYCIPIYFLIHFQYSAGHFFQYYVVMLLVGAYTSYMGQMVASLTPNLQVANILFSMIMTFHFTFGGGQKQTGPQTTDICPIRGAWGSSLLVSVPRFLCDAQCSCRRPNFLSAGSSCTTCPRWPRPSCLCPSNSSSARAPTARRSSPCSTAAR